MEKSNCPMPLEDIKERVLCAIVDLYRYDGDLLDGDANERSITHKLAEHLQRQFPEWNVDCEYNRHGDEVKRLAYIYEGDTITAFDAEAKTVFPDIIVHKRGRRINLVVIEVKKLDSKSNREKDVMKLSAFTEENAPYQYCFGLLLEISAKYKKTKLAIYRKGKENAGWTQDLRKRLEELGSES